MFPNARKDKESLDSHMQNLWQPLSKLCQNIRLSSCTLNKVVTVLFSENPFIRIFGLIIDISVNPWFTKTGEKRATSFAFLHSGEHYIKFVPTCRHTFLVQGRNKYFKKTYLPRTRILYLQIGTNFM